MKVAFIGLGNMGSGMARNILAAGHEVTVWNRSPEKAEALKAEGAQLASSPAAACAGAEAVVTMLADDAAVEAVTFGAKGVASAMDGDATHISCSTISTELARRLTSGHSDRGQLYLSAPVFGRPEAAASKRLLVVAAGPRQLIERCQPLLDAIGRQTMIAGTEPWQANLVKICGNFTIVSAIEALGEAFAAVRKSGIAPEVFRDVIGELYGSPVYRGYGGAIAEGKFAPGGFALRLGLKDVRLMLQAADECVAPMPMASLVRDNMLNAMANGQSELDWSSLALVSARNAGLPEER